MKKSFLGFEIKKKELSFSQLDVPFQSHFIKEYALTGGIALLAIIFFAMMKMWLYIAISLLIYIVYGSYVYTHIYKALTNQLLVIDATCIDLERKENKLLGSHSKEGTTAKTCTLLLETEDGLKIKQEVAYASVYKTGDVVRIFTEDGNISQINQTTFTILNPIFMYVLAN